ncbi:MAG: hypothetical protein JWO38_52 [Gemmataceae bacterium]|nr:hypothetical protein [Gemmataceae bacterium]
MATAKLSDMVTRLGGQLPAQPDPAAADADLLARFLADRDDRAFAQLVRRHGPMVFGVCRRVTGNHHLAEDAFQAVFVVLARKADTVRPRAALSAWLYGVAYRTALRARTMADRRRRREAPVEIPPEPAATPADPVEAADLAVVLDEEIAGLPDRLRAAVILCELEGHSRQEAADRLGVPEGTLSSRLAAARKALAARLRGRGIALSAAGLAAAFGRVAAAVVPPALTAKAVAGALTPGAVPVPVAALSNGVFRIMFAQKLKAVPVALGLAAAVVAGGLLLAADPPAKPVDRPKQTAAPADPPKPSPAPAAKAADPKPLPKGPNKILFYKDGHLTMIDPDGKNESKVTEDRGKFHPGDGHLSPDGKSIAYLIQVEGGGEPPDAGRDPRRKLYVKKLDDKEPGTDLGVECQLFAWSPDSTRIAVSDFVDGREKKPVAVHHIVNVKTKEKTAVKLPEDHVITDWSRDGDYFLTTSMVVTDGKLSARIHLMNQDGTEHKALTDGKQIGLFGRLSPDGTRVLYHVMIPPREQQAQARRELAVLDVATGKSAAVADAPLNGDIQAYCWSPNGKQIAYTWREIHEGKPEDVANKETESHLVVCDPDGKNQKTIASEKAQGQWIITIGHVDWR